MESSKEETSTEGKLGPNDTQEKENGMVKQNDTKENGMLKENDSRENGNDISVLTDSVDKDTKVLEQSSIVEKESDLYEDSDTKERRRKELEELLKACPYNLIVALIKISQINKYQPLELEKYYTSIIPSLHLLRKTNGGRYTTQSVMTVKSAMVSNKIFIRNDDNLYELHFENAINYLKSVQAKNPGPNTPTVNEIDDKDLEERLKTLVGDDFDNIDNDESSLCPICEEKKTV